MVRGNFYSTPSRIDSWGLLSPQETAAPTAHPSPQGKSTVALINIGMWFGMKTGTRPSVAVKCYCEKKSKAAYMPSCPLPAFFFFFLALDPPEVSRSVSEAQGAGFS